MKARKYLIIICLILTSCDYWADHTYTVTNGTNNIVTIKTNISKDNTFLITDSVYIIKPNESKKIIDEVGKLCGRSYIPDSWYEENDIIPKCDKFDIYLDDKPAPTHLRLYKFWNFTAKKRLGKYELVITDELLNLQ